MTDDFFVDFTLDQGGGLVSSDSKIMRHSLGSLRKLGSPLIKTRSNFSARKTKLRRKNSINSESSDDGMMDPIRDAMKARNTHGFLLDRMTVA